MKLESLCVLFVNHAPLDIRSTIKIPDTSLVLDFYFLN